MNKTYRNIWNAATGTWTAVAETAKSHSKGSARVARQAVVALALGSASIGGAFAADVCETADGVSGSLDEARVCQAPVVSKNTRSIGTTATALDDAYIKVETGTYAPAIDAQAGNSATAIGANANANAMSAVALGGSATAGYNSVSLGTISNATYEDVAVGVGANASGGYSVAVGRAASASGGNAVALGRSAIASADGAMALGRAANASAAGAVALGYGAVADRVNTVSVGSSAGQRAIVNMAAGTQATDAVNVSQLTPVVSALGGGATINPTTGAVTGPQYNLANGGLQLTVGGALSALDGALTTANGNIAKNATDITTINNKLGAVVSDDYVKVDTSSGAAAARAGGSAVAVGANAQGTGIGATVVGNNTVASSQNSSAFGIGAQAVGGTGITTGAATAIGAYASASGFHSSALGVGAIASGSESVALGVNSRADRDNSVSVGNATQQRQITNMAAGTQATDAVNVSQLEPVVTALGGGAAIDPTTGAVTGPTYNLANGGTQTTVGGALGALDGELTTAKGDIADLADQIGSGTVGLVQQDAATRDITVAKDTDGTVVNFAGTAGDRKLAGVAAGEVSATSNEAINGSQLHGVSQSVADAIGAGSTVNPDGSITAPSFTVGDGNGGTTIVHNVGDVVTNLDGRVTNNEGAIAHLGDQLAAGEIGLVRQDPATGAIMVGAATGGSTVNFAGTDGARTLSGVANGRNDDDAVTIAQLKATGLIDYTGKEIAAVTYDDIMLGSVTFGGTGGTALHNVAPGLIAANSMDAVNGSQLYDMQQEFAQQFGQLSGQMNDLTDRVGELETGSGGGSGGGMGPGTGTGGDGSLVIGEGSNASGENSSAIGQGSVATGDNGTAVGQGSVATGGNGTAIGQGSTASGENGTAVGQGSVASGENSTAIGQGSSATGSGSVAIGAGSIADEANTVSFGNGTEEGNRRLVNVADGVNASDAATKGQLDRAMESVDQRFGETNRMINDVAKNAYAGVAAAMAMPNLTPSQPGKTVVAVGAANYKSGSAVAAGATYRTRDGKWLMNGALSVTSTGDAGVRAQVGYEF
nr:ESPR-type extended signal peptide-containing protein [Burkholderia cenocepacia]